MRPVFGPHTKRVVQFLTNLRELSPSEIDEVAGIWKAADDLDRAQAWAQLQRVTTQEERYLVLAAATTARRVAMDTAHKLSRSDWASWAAACDAAAAIAAGDRLSADYDTLTAPLAAVMPWLASSQAGDEGQAPGLPRQRLPEPAAEQGSREGTRQEARQDTRQDTHRGAHRARG
jgi:hypothetical protein